MRDRRHSIWVILLCGTLSCVASHVAAQVYPSRPVTMIVPYAAGGSADVVGRIVAAEMSKALGQNFVIELKPGAGGNIGAEFVARSARKDGYTILLASLSLSSNVSLMKLNFDPRKDLMAVAGIATLPNLMVTAIDSPYKSFKEAMAAARQHPGKLSYGSSGPGTSSHLTGELLNSAAGIELLHVPYKGTGGAYPDLMARRVDFLFDLAGSATGYVQGGKARALATTAPRRSQVLPDVPAIAESFPGFQFGAYLALFTPEGTPREIVAQLESAAAKAIQSPQVKERLAQMGAESVPTTASGFQKYFDDDVERFARLVREGTLKALQ